MEIVRSGVFLPYRLVSVYQMCYNACIGVEVRNRKNGGKFHVSDYGGG